MKIKTEQSLNNCGKYEFIVYVGLQYYFSEFSIQYNFLDVQRISNYLVFTVASINQIKNLVPCYNDIYSEIAKFFESSIIKYVYSCITVSKMFISK